MNRFLITVFLLLQVTQQTHGQLLGVPPMAPSATGNPVCYVCGSPTSVVTNLFATVEIPPEFDSPLQSVDCSLAVTGGLNGFVPPDFCTLIQLNAEFKQVCGCVETMIETTEPETEPAMQIPADEIDTRAREDEDDMPPIALPADEPEMGGSKTDDEPASSATSMFWSDGTALVGTIMMAAAWMVAAY